MATDCPPRVSTQTVLGELNGLQLTSLRDSVLTLAGGVVTGEWVLPELVVTGASEGIVRWRPGHQRILALTGGLVRKLLGVILARRWFKCQHAPRACGICGF